jgi:hypothetical protein
MWQQVKTPNPDVPYVGGDCLDAQVRSFGVDHVYETAIDQWDATPGNNHTDRPPAGIAVPVFFSLGSAQPDGHVAGQLANGAVASSSQPGSHAELYIHANIDALIKYYSTEYPNIEYLGWSEILGNEAIVIQGDNMVSDDTLDFNVLSQTFKDCTGRALTQPELQEQVGRNWQDVLITFQGSPETAAWTAKAESAGVVLNKTTVEAYISGNLS